MIRPSFCGIILRQLENVVLDYGFDRQYALKIIAGFYRRGIHDFPEMDNIPVQLRKHLDSGFTPGLFPPVKSEVSSDNTEKHLFINRMGQMFESVVIPDRNRKTICLSSQSGCRMGCPFCLTGKSGFNGDLTSGEIINQVISVPGQKDINHVVFMGMGEPMDNLEQVLKACEILTSSWGLAVSPRNITVSTVGITPAIKRYLELSDCNLTLSLFSPFSYERAGVVPAEKRFPAEEIIEMMKEYPVRKKRRLSIAYVMIKDVNDSDRHLDRLIGLLKGTSLRVNLLPYHLIPGDSFISSPHRQMQYFANSLLNSGISASIRKSRGADISAACGLLAAGVGRINN